MTAAPRDPGRSGPGEVGGGRRTASHPGTAHHGPSQTHATPSPFPLASQRHSSGADGTRAVYVISVAAELAGVHPQTLRVYERRGLLDPSRTSGGSRRFSERDLARLRRIQDLTATGVNLEGVRRILELEAELSGLRAELEQARAEAREAVERTHRQYRRDLVPVDQSPVPYIAIRRRRTGR